jgi:ribonucleoside-diphosphate reductase alpha chain
LIEDTTWKFAEETHTLKYRQPGETFKTSMCRVANHLKDSEEHYHAFKDILVNRRFLPGGRVQSASGAARQVTAFNCFVMDDIPDSLEGIMRVLSEAARTQQMGGGVGYNFSTLRPRGAIIKTLGSQSSGPLSFMDIFDAMCAAISSAGHRRGAQMACMRVDHPDIEEFISSKNNGHRFTNFNISVLITDEFMSAVENGDSFDLKFDGKVYSTVSASALWDQIMRSTWDYAEPGVIFIDRVNRKNNLWYCETISATNPCGEQPLPPYGACLLGSFNLTQYVVMDEVPYFDYMKFIKDIPIVVRAMDNIIDRTIYPLAKQEYEAKSKRRMGLGVTGLANALEALCASYGSGGFLFLMEQILIVLRDSAYEASIKLAKEKGPFPLFNPLLLESEFARTLPRHINSLIREGGIRNSHLLSMAPTGTISLTAGNVSGSIEPPFSHYYDRDMREFDRMKTERVSDYAYREWGIKGKTALELSPLDHVKVLNLASQYVDSACSKTCNIGDDVSWEDFKEVYVQAYKGGASGCTTYRAAGMRKGILNTVETPAEEVEGLACTWDTETGKRTCE